MKIGKGIWVFFPDDDHPSPIRRLKPATLDLSPVQRQRGQKRETPPWKHGGVFGVN